MPVSVSIQGRLPGELGRIVQQYFPEMQVPPANAWQQQNWNDAVAPSDPSAAGSATNPVIIDVEGGAAAPPDLSGAAQAQPNHDENQNTAHTHSHAANPPRAGAGEDPNRLSVRRLMKVLEGSIVFIILALAKIMYDHRLGILIFVALFGTFYHSNWSLKKYITQREVSRHINILWIMVFLMCNIAVIYYAFSEQELWRSLLLQLPKVGEIEVWNLLWVVAVTDFVIKFAVIAVKCALALLPRSLMAIKKRGKFYMMLEHTSQFYRALTPIRPWVQFLLDDLHGGEWFSMLLTCIYAVCKCQQLLVKGKELKIIFTKFHSDVSYGMCASKEELKGCENTCPICQDTLSDPVKLNCKHIFCEDCVSMWFNRERTCPMCRANIVDNPQWRDGTTSAAMQLY